MKRKTWLIVFCIELVIVCAASIVLWQLNQEKPFFQQKPAMYIEPSDKRPQLQASHQQAFDFRTDGSLKSVVLEVWELENGQWVALGGGRFGVSLQKGQFSLGFSYLPAGITYAVGGDNYTYTIDKHFNAEFASAASSMLYTTMLSQLTEISYETPLPVALQIYTNNPTPQYIGVDFFRQPHLLAAENHERVLALTLTFSKESME